MITAELGPVVCGSILRPHVMRSEAEEEGEEQEVFPYLISHISFSIIFIGRYWCSLSRAISLAPDFSQVAVRVRLVLKPFQRFIRETVETVSVISSPKDHRTEVRC